MALDKLLAELEKAMPKSRSSEQRRRRLRDVKATMTATEVMALLSPEPCPRDLEETMGQKLDWQRTDFKKSIMPALEYAVAMENGDTAAIDRLGALIASLGLLQQGQRALEEFLRREGKTAANLLAQAKPLLEEIHRAEEAWGAAGKEVNEIAASGNFEVTGIPAVVHIRSGEPMDGARPEVIDSKLFRGGHHLIDDQNRVMTRNGYARYSDVRFLTAQIEEGIEQRKEQRAEAAEQEVGHTNPDDADTSAAPANEQTKQAGFAQIAAPQYMTPGPPNKAFMLSKLPPGCANDPEIQDFFETLWRVAWKAKREKGGPMKRSDAVENASDQTGYPVRKRPPTVSISPRVSPKPIS